MYCYTAYGLGICSALPLPELVPGEAVADVEIRLGRVDPFLPEATRTGTGFRATAQEARFFYEAVGTFLVRGGREIVLEPAPGVEERTLRLFILGPALAILLQQKGRLILHASAISISGGAVALLGGPGWGKSTLAAAIHSRGHGMVADDVTAIQIETISPMVFPGFPQLKLWPEAAVALGYPLETLPQLHPQLQKRARRITHGFSLVPLPLRCIYVLAESTVQEIEPLRPQEALVELVRHSYGVRLLAGTGASAHFLQCAHVVQSVAIRRLKRHRSLAALPDLAQMVEADLAHL